MEVDGREALLSKIREPSKTGDKLAELEQEGKLWDAYADSTYGPKPAILITG